MAEELSRELEENEPAETDAVTADAAENEPEQEQPTEAEATKEHPDGQEPDETDGQEPEPSDEGDKEQDASGDSKEKKPGTKKDGFFKKKKDKRDEQIEELQDKLKRQMAEFENFRRRTDREKSQMFDMGARTIIEKMLPVVDNFERGLAAVPEEQKEDPFVTGMDKVYKQLMTELEAIGVVPIEAVGKEFDPELHNAVMQVENGELEAGTVADELQKGYRYRDTVVRHSMVSVVS